MTFEKIEEILKNRLLQDATAAMKDGFSSLSDEMKYKEFCRLLDENDNLRNQLKQRDEVIKNINNRIEEYVSEKYNKTNSAKQFSRYMELPHALRSILFKYKGDSNE